MWRLSAAALAAGLLLSGAALAQSADSQTVPDKIRQKLSEQGFKDVQVEPGSYVVSATDKSGNPVMMLIGPTEITVLSALPKDGAQDPQQAQTPDKGDTEILQQ